MSRRWVLAADLGGTKILAALVDEAGAVQRLHEAPTPAAQGAEAVLTALQQVLADARGDAAPQAMGLSLAGVIDPRSARVLDATEALPGWKGSDLRRALADFGLPVQARNDVHAALLGEAWLGALQGRDSGVLLTLGTGLGGALLLNGQLHEGSHHLAGHIGRTEVLHEGGRVPLEALLSGTGLARLHGSARDGREVIARLLQGEPRAEAALQAWVEQLALLLHNLHWLLDPGCVLIGGGMIDARAHWWSRLQPLIAGLPLAVQPAALGSRAGLLGAARIAWQGDGA